MPSILQILRRIGGVKAAPATGQAGQLAMWTAGTAPTDTASLYAHDGVQWKEIVDTGKVPVTPGVTIFDPAKTYAAGDMVTYQGNIYTSPAAVAAGAWDATKWNNIAPPTTGGGGGAGAINFFDPAKAYAIGDIVVAGTGAGTGIFMATAANGPAAWDGVSWAWISNMSSWVNKIGDTMTGTLEIGNADPIIKLHRHGVVWWDWKTTPQGEMGMINNSGGWAWLSSGTSLHVPGNVIAYWSDARLKQNVEDLDGYEARIMGLRPVSFEWNEKGRKRTGKTDNHREIGFIAQEVLSVCPQFVAENETPSDDDSTVYLTVQKDQMIADLVAMVQELNKRIAKLEGK